MIFDTFVVVMYSSWIALQLSPFLFKFDFSNYKTLNSILQTLENKQPHMKVVNILANGLTVRKPLINLRFDSGF